jgi:hypothetical protein
MEGTQKYVYKSAKNFALILLLFVFVGFFKTYFGIAPTFNEKITPLIHFHFMFLMSWVVLLVVQPLLIRYKKYRIHKLLGKCTYFIAPVIVASLISMMVRTYYKSHMENWPWNEIVMGIYSQLIHAIQFAIFYLLALVYKRDLVLHASYMIATGLVFINPSLTRAIGLSGLTYPIVETIVIAFIDVTILALLFYFKKKGIDYRHYLLILLLFQIHDIPMLFRIWYH